MNKHTFYKILSQYDIQSKEEAFLLKEGIDNDLYVARLSNAKKVVIRSSKRDISDSVQFETQLLSFLTDKKGPVPQIVPTKSDKLSVFIKDTSTVVFEFVEGETITVDKDHKPSGKLS